MRRTEVHLTSKQNAELEYIPHLDSGRSCRNGAKLYYSKHIAETFWRMLKAQWIQPADYVSIDNLLYAVYRGLSGLGNTHFINFSKRA